MITLQNEQLEVVINARGAEIQRVYSKEFRVEYIWDGNPAFWAKKSPVLFPIVGQLINNTYYYNDISYTLPRHGFARDMEFTVESSTAINATFLLESNEETLKAFPFYFQLRIHYQLDGSTLQVTYDVTNTDTKAMYFSIGGHPAFATPISEQVPYSSYYLEFEHLETTPRYRLKDGIIDGATAFLNNEHTIPVSYPLFYNDAIILKNLRSTSVSLKNTTNTHGVTVTFKGCPFLGIWSAKDAPFVCIEPWNGITDTQGHNQQLTDKEGINIVLEKENWQQSWSMAFF